MAWSRRLGYGVGAALALAALLRLGTWGLAGPWSAAPRTDAVDPAPSMVGSVAVYPGAQQVGQPEPEVWEGSDVLVYRFLAAGPPAVVADWYDHHTSRGWRHSDPPAGEPPGTVEMVSWHAGTELRLTPNPSLVWAFPVHLEHRVDTRLEIALTRR